jgi:hypothetical protein
LSGIASPLLVFGLGLQRLQPAVPELLQERPDLGEPLGTGAIEPTGALAALADEPRVAQHAQVLGDRGPGHVGEVGGDGARRQLLVADEAQDGASPRFDDGFEGSLHSHNRKRWLS